MNQVHHALALGSFCSLLVLIGCSGAGSGNGGPNGSGGDGPGGPAAGGPTDEGGWQGAGGPNGTGASAGAATTFGGAGGAPPNNGCAGLRCDVPCGYVTYNPNDSSPSVAALYLADNCECSSLVPLCGAGGAGGSPSGGASNAGAGGPSSGGDCSAGAGGPSSGAGGGWSYAGGSSYGGGAGASPGGGVCSGMSCGAVCGYFSQSPGGPTQPMMCDLGQRCTPTVPYCGY